MLPRARAPLAAVAVLASCAGPEAPSPGPAADPCALATPGEQWLAFASRRTGDYELYLTRADGGCRHAITADPAQDLFPTWSPDGRIAFASDRGGKLGLWVHDLAAGSTAPIDVGGIPATAPAFSPDGRLIAFEGRPPGSASRILLVPAEGGVSVPVGGGTAGDDAGPAWSPDGRTVYFVSTRTGLFDVFAVPAAGGEAVQVTVGSRIVGKPAVSPDGASLYFARTRQGSSATEVVRQDLATGAAAVITSADDSEPAVSPRGGRLAVRTFRSGAADLVLMDAADGGNPVPLTSDPASDGTPAFRPVP